MASARVVFLAMLATALANDVFAQNLSSEDEAAITKKSQNPLSTMISVPFQSDFNFNQGFHDRTQYILTIKPVYPISGKKWNLINRAVIPIVSQPAGPVLDKTGLGDINYTLFFSPAGGGKVIWGIGPSITLPTNTDGRLGADKWTAGPSMIMMNMRGRFIFGGLVNQLWSFAGNDDRADVSSFMFQYMFNYNLQNGWLFRSTPVIMANWKADSGQKWTVPIGGGFAKVGTVGKQHFLFHVQSFYNVEKPDNASDWTFEISFTFLFPKGG
jgi:hypothetical protein